MAVIARIQPFSESDEPDSLGRNQWGYYPNMPEEAAFEAGRGVWKLGPAADSERFVMVVAGAKGKGRVIAVGEIDALQTDEVDPNRRFIVGRVLPAGHPVRDAYIGQMDPSKSASQNPIAYVDLPEEAPYRTRACACGCGADTQRDFAPGHDQKAIHDRIRNSFGGSTMRFIEWFDQNGPATDGV